jgi:DNA polymerase (family 10)
MNEAALIKIPGVGKSIAAKIVEFQETGEIAAVEGLRGKVPPGAREFTKVPGLGPKRAMQLSRELNVASVAELQEAIRQGRLRNLGGFGPKSEERILRGLAVMTSDRVLLSTAMDTATGIVARAGAPRRARRVRRVAAPDAGDDRGRRHPRDDGRRGGRGGDHARIQRTRRDEDNSNKRESADNSSKPSGEDLADADADADAAGTDGQADSGVIVSGPAKTSIRVSAGVGRGLQVDMRVVKPQAYGAALQYFTGSQAHNVRSGRLLSALASSSVSTGWSGQRARTRKAAMAS